MRLWKLLHHYQENSAVDPSFDFPLLVITSLAIILVNDELMAVMTDSLQL
jgi:hypothetical protein